MYQLTFDDFKVLDDAWDAWGEQKQLLQFIEEAGEAIVAICHYFRGRVDETKILEETVDVELMANQVKRQLSKKVMPLEYYDSTMQFKLRRLKNRVDAHNERLKNGSN